MKKIECVLLPGLDGTGKFLERFASEISGYASPSIVSYPRDRRLSYEELADYVRDRLPAERDYCIIAESFSGPIAVSIASGHPNRLQCLILVASFASCPYPRSSRFWLGIVPILARIPIPKGLMEFFLLNGRRPEIADTLHELTNSIDRSVLLGRVRSALTCDVTKKLEQVSIPVLAIQATQDRVIPKRCIGQMSKHLPSMQTARIKAAHFVLQLEAKTVSEKIVYPFLHSVLSSSAL